jgi:protein-L-isoaspartate(D-aspartate) O-methyltransferase
MLAEHVTSIEIFPDISISAQKSWQRLQLENIKGEVGNAALGWEPLTAFDVICITGSVPNLADHWRRQLNIGGRLFVVIGEPPLMHATLITRVSHQEWTNQILYETLVPTLINAEQPPQFEF